MGTSGSDSETVAFRMQLNPGAAAEYQRRHTDIWPELRTALFAAGVIDYRIFLDPDSNFLFAVLTRRKVHQLEQLRQMEVMRRWWRMMRDIMHTHADDSPVEVSLLPMFELQK